MGFAVMAPSYAVAAAAPSPGFGSCAPPATRRSASASRALPFSGLRNVSAWGIKAGYGLYSVNVQVC